MLSSCSEALTLTRPCPCGYRIDGSPPVRPPVSTKLRRSWLTPGTGDASLPARTTRTGPLMPTERLASAAFPIRDDLAAAHARAWTHIARPGTWWDGAARVAIVAETRQASLCTLCRRRKGALSSFAIEGTHDSLGQLPEIAVEVVHHVVTDPGRLGERWYRGVIKGGLTEEQYVEIVSVVAHTVAIDTMARGLGHNMPPLPMPEPGAPSRYRPPGAKPAVLGSHGSSRRM